MKTTKKAKNMKRYFVNHKEVTYREYLQSTEQDKIQIPAKAKAIFDKNRRLLCWLTAANGKEE